MSIATLENVIVQSARVIFKNSKLRKKDLMEWRTSKFDPHPGEVLIYLDDPGVYVAIKSELDKR